MRMPILSRPRRRGMTLLEVLMALAIFLFSLLAISQLFNSASDQALGIQAKSRSTRLAQSKMAEFSAGVVSLQTGGSGTFDEEPEWSWNADIQQDGTAQGLYIVTITVSRGTGKGRNETSLTQYVLDPKTKGTIGTSSSSDSATPAATAATPTTGGM